MRSIRVTLSGALIALCLAAPARAQQLGRGNSMVWLGLHGGRAQVLTSPLAIEGRDEVGVHGAYSYFFSDAWTVVASGGIDTGKQRIETPFTPPLDYASHSWNARIGVDRYGFINPDVAVYAGPGLLYWRGHNEIPDTGLGGSHLPDVTQVAFNGRIGMLTRVKGPLGLFGHLGLVIGSNTSDEGGVKTTWWSSTPEGSVGLSYDF